MNKLIAAFRERHIWRVLVAYPSVTFIWLQAVEFFINNYGLDERLLTVSLIVAIVLFPAAAIWNWRHGEAGAQSFNKPEIGAYIVFGAAAVLAGSWYWNNSIPSGRSTDLVHAPARTIAVMPFENAAGDNDVQFLCDGIAESLINWLSTVRNIKVISKSAAFRLRQYADDTAKIADALGVDGIIRGRLERVGDRVVVSTSFVDTRDDSQLWGERLVQPAQEVMYLERSIVETIKAGLRLEVGSDDIKLTAAGGTDNPADDGVESGRSALPGPNVRPDFLKSTHENTGGPLGPPFFVCLSGSRKAQRNSCSRRTGGEYVQASPPPDRQQVISL